jgi:hypothetical protein
MVCHESGHLWFGGLVQTLNTTEKGFIEESTTSYCEVDCVASTLLSLSNSAIYTEMFAPPYGDNRGLHIGALFHALEEFTLPKLSRVGIIHSIPGRYAKGAAWLHMMESFIDGTHGEV